MFSKHVAKDLSAYCNGELNADESRHVAEHLIACNRCRDRYEEIKLGVKLAEQIPQLSAPESLWADIENKRATQSVTTSPATRASFLGGWQRPLAWSMAAIVLVGGVSLVWFYTRETRPSWEVARVEGAPRINADRMAEKGQLAVGQWLETDNDSRAKIEVSSIGHVEIDPNTRVRLVETKPTEHRLELAHGRMSATIWAPPRLFFVDTPAAVAADLGCAYTLEVDDHGDGLLHVTVGWVALQLKDRESLVPAGASCATRQGLGPGTPYFDDATIVFRQALSRIDFAPDLEPTKIADLDLVLMDARPRDTLTLWHLLRRFQGNDRARVYERMTALVPPPEGVTREGVMQLNEQMLGRWKESLAPAWNANSNSGLRKAMIKSWAKALGTVNGFVGKR